MTTERPRPGELLLVGLLAGGVALAALWAASSVAPRIPFPPAAFAEGLIRVTPGGVATFFIEVLDHWALRLLTVGVLAMSLAVGARALVATAREGRPRPLLAACVLAMLAAAASLVSGLGGVDVVATLFALAVAAAAYVVTCSSLLRLFAAGHDSGRRRALTAGISGAVGVALAGGVLGWVVRRLAGPDTDVALTPAATPAEIPERAPFPSVDGLTREVTSVGDHYVVDINLVRPVVEAEGWALEVAGEVDRPLRLTFTELQRRFEMVEEYAVLTCVSNEVGGDLVGHSLWGGVRLGDVLGAARPRAGVVDLVFRAADGYSDSIPADLAGDPGVLLAVAQNRRPLTQEHGFPCRLRVPPIYGMKNVKWIESIEAVGSNFQGYWQRRGWSDVAVVRTQSRIDVAGHGGTATRGRQTWIAGVAWAGDRGIAKVEVSTDGGGTWQQAQLRAPVGPLSWRQWALRWTPREPGDVVVTCRATDGRGDVQTSEEASPHPAGATGLHAVSVAVV